MLTTNRDSMEREYKLVGIVASKLAPFAGVSLALLSSLLCGISTILVKVNVDASAIALTICAFCCQATFFLPFCIHRGNCLITDKSERVLLLQRVFFAGFNIFSTAQSLRHISASDMTAIVFCAPILTSLVSPLMTKEKFQNKNLFLAALAAVGVFLICRPSIVFANDEPVTDTEETNKLIGVGWAFACCCSQIYLMVVASKMTRTPVLVAMFNVGCVVSAIFVGYWFATRTQTWPQCGVNSVTLMFAGVTGIMAAMTENFSIRAEKLSTLSTSLTFQIIFIMVVDVFVLQERLFWSDYLGAGMVLSSMISILLLKARKVQKTPTNDDVEIDRISLNPINS